MFITLISIIASSISKSLLNTLAFYTDEYWSSVVLSLRGNVPIQDFESETVLNMHMDGADPNWTSVVLGMHMGDSEVDPYWSNVSLLMLMNGTNASTTIGDITGKTVTVVGNAAISTEQSKFGGASCSFDGTGDYLTIPASSAFSFGTGDFTIELSVRFNSLGDMSFIGSSDYYGMEFGATSTSLRIGIIDTAWYSSVPWAPAINTWYSICYARSGTTVYIFVNGTLLGTTTDSHNYFVNTALVIGAGGVQGGPWRVLNGYIDNLRITKGVARYTDTFTPPNREFPTGATTIYDVKGHPISVFGNTSIVSTQYRFGGYSCYFDGTGDYITLSSTSDFGFGTGDFTTEAWIYISGNQGADRNITDFRTALGNPGTFFIDTTNKLAFWYGSKLGGTGTALTTGVWYHVALSRASGIFYCYLNGILEWQSTTTVDFTTSCPLGIGGGVYSGGEGTSPFNGYIDDLRITKGTAIYTAAFTPPSRVFPHDISFYDEKGLVPTLSGTPTISTSTLKYGYGSASFNGTTDYLTFDASTNFGFGTGDFTLEAWIKTSAVGTLLDFRNYASDYGHFYITTGGYLAFDHLYGTIVGTTTVTDNSWHHVAFVRYNNILTLFVDGTDSGASIANSNIGSNRQARIGAKVDGTNFFAGNIDQLRLTKAARYLSEFTPQKYMFEDTNNNQIWRDETGINSVSANGNAQVYSASYKYGNGSMYFDGNGDRVAIVNGSTSITGDFTLEFWLNWTQAGSDVNFMQAEFGFGIANSGSNISVRDTTAAFRYFNAKSELTSNVWHHLAIVRHNGVCRFFLNGVMHATTYTDTGTVFANGATWYLGTRGTDQYYTGFLDDVRVTAVARYVSNFTPPVRQNPNLGVPTIYDPYWDAVVLGMHMDGVDNGTTFTDVRGATITVTGNTVTKTATKKFGTASAYFDGTGDYLSISGTSSLQLGTADFTIEFWCNLISVSDWGRILSTGSYLTSGNINIIKEQTTNKIYFQISDTATRPYITSNSSITDSKWHHCAFQRKSNMLEMFIDGVKQSLTTSDSPHNLTSNSLKLGIGFSEDGNSSTANMNGYIDDLRVTKGVARYTTNFQPAQYAFSEILTPVKTYLDPHYDSVVLNMHMNGPNGSAAFVDEIGKIATVAGNTSLSIAQSKFGGVSAYFDGTGDYLSFASSSSFGFGTSDFTIEGWIYITGSQGTDRNITDFRSSSASDIGTFFIDGPTNKLAFWYGTKIGATGVALTGSVWYHVALVRSSGTISCYLNGILDWSVVATIDFGSSRVLAIGATIATGIVGNGPFMGHIDDLRITKGVARYTSSFTIPSLPNPDFKLAPAATDPYWKNVVLHLPMNGADGGTTFVENTGKTVTVNGNTSTQVEQYRFGGSSAYFDGTGDYLSLAYDKRLTIQNDEDYTIEMWTMLPALADGGLVALTSSTTNNTFAQVRIGTTATGKFYLLMAQGGDTAWVSEAEATYAGSSSYTAGVWHHVAFVKSGTSYSLFVNGVSRISYTGPTTPYESGGPTLIGAIDSSPVTSTFTGYIDDLRITKGVARYTATFTPPSLPNPTGYDPYAPNVVLHLPMNTDFTDGTGKTVTVSGNSVISTTVKKFGAGSGYFDGTGDYLNISSTDLDYGTGDFTMECWVNFQGIGNGYPRLIEQVSYPSTNGFQLQLQTGSTTPTVTLSNNSTGVITSTSTLIVGRWNHIAVTRSGGTLRLFINGVKEGTDVTGNTTNCSSGYVRIAVGTGGNDALKGYLDDVRLTKGIARYTANFTPPREPFSLT